jgi:hypothetical protein
VTSSNLQSPAAPPSADSSSDSKPRAGRSAYIVNPFFDGVFFIFAPLIALALGVAISDTPWSQNEVSVLGHRGSITNIFVGSFIAAHLVIVFFRSHGNRNIFRLYPIRFTLVPLALFALVLLSKWALVTVTVLAVWWDVYHSSLQTFGLGRIYDARRGNDPAIGRRLDYWLNLLLYAGPILGGVALMDHVDSFEKFSQVGAMFLAAVPAQAASHARWLTIGVLAVGVPFLIGYVAAYWRLHRRGYEVSFQKVILYASTGACSIYTWGFNTFGEAFFIMNFFHAWQYFALVWWTEQQNMTRLFRLGGLTWGKPLALALYVALALGYGFWAEVSARQNDLVLAIVLVVSIMHFWYDGFIWSVRKKQV